MVMLLGFLTAESWEVISGLQILAPGLFSYRCSFKFWSILPYTLGLCLSSNFGAISVLVFCVDCTLAVST